MRIKMKRFLGILLSLALVLGLMPGMSLTAYADDPYASLKNSTTVIKFASKDWYLINYDADTVTLLAQKCVVESPYDPRGSFLRYSQSKVKSVVDNWYTDNIKADAKKAVSGGAMFLLTKEEAKAITNADVRKDATAKNNGWWLCSQGYLNTMSAYVIGVSGEVDKDGYDVRNTFGVRPALKLDLSKVTFDSTSNTFSLIKYPLWVGGVQVTSANAGNIDGNYKASYDATTNTLTLDGYSFSGTGYADQGGYSGAIYAGEGFDLNLVLSGTDSVENNSTSSMQCGIYAGGALTISGNGTLKAGAKDRGISCRGKLTIRSGNVTAKNNSYSGHGMFVDGDVEISGGTVSVEGASNGICSQGGSVTISGGEVTAKSEDGEGVFAQRQIKITGGKVTAETKSRIGMSSYNVNVTIEGGEIIAIGNEKGIGGTVVNAIPGTGWTDRDGTAGKAGIPVSTSGQSLDYKKVQFPGESLPPAEVTTKPTAKTLTYTGSAQELVTAAPTHVPKTGDGANLVLWIGLILLGFLGIIAFTGVAGRKHRNR